MHGNDGVDVHKNTILQTCSVERDEDTGECPSGTYTGVVYSSPTDANYPISTTSGSNCKAPGANGTCRAAGEKTVTVGYDARLQSAAGGAVTGVGDAARVSPSSAACMSPETWCSTGDVIWNVADIPAGVSRIIADGRVVISGSGAGDFDLSDMTLISTRRSVSIPPRIRNLRIFSNEPISLGAHVVAEGHLTLASRGRNAGSGTCGVDFKGQSPLIQQGAVTFLVVSETCIKVSGGPSGEVAGFFVTGGDFHWAGSPGVNFYGGIASVGTLHFSGVPRSSFESGLTLVSPDTLEETEINFSNAVLSFIVMR